MTFVDTHPWKEAFVANLLERLVAQITDQGEELLADIGLPFPSRAVSSILLIGERGSISVADIAKTLEQPHQLVTQRIDLLIRLDVVERTVDPNDARRKILKLTPIGRDQFKLLQLRLTQATQVFIDLFKEIDCDLSAVAMRAMSALDQRSITERANSLKITQ
ncbi:MAG: MarR family transcriptional regulator [Hyphomonadaceae bacterium]